MNRLVYVLDITERKRSEELIWKQAHYDAVTGLPNRNLFRILLEEGRSRAELEGHRLALFLIDLDHFKEVNDILGHSAGDMLLGSIAARIKNSLGDNAAIARLGGDEFALIINEPDYPEWVDGFAQRVLDELARPFHLDGEVVFVSASVGVAIYPDDSANVDDLFKSADQAMYEAKRAGRNCFSYFTPALQCAALNRLHLANELRSALTNDEFEVYYQPIIDLRDGSLKKAEALLRWNHPERGVVGPYEFISIAESTGLIVKIGNWVANEVIDKIIFWRERFLCDLQISINVSPIQFRVSNASDFDWVRKIEDAGLDGRSLLVEITEGLLLNADPLVKKNLLFLRESGIEVAIDDFGTGYSSLAYLRKFDIDYLKIDRSFVEDLDGVGFDLCEAIVAMAHRLGLKVVAEGIETTKQRDVLASIGCDYGQGYLFSRPVQFDSFTAMLSKRSGCA